MASLDGQRKAAQEALQKREKEYKEHFGHLPQFRMQEREARELIGLLEASADFQKALGNWECTEYTIYTNTLRRFLIAPLAKRGYTKGLNDEEVLWAAGPVAKYFAAERTFHPPEAISTKLVTLDMQVLRYLAGLLKSQTPGLA